VSAEAVLAALRTRGLTLATAESLTGGLVGAALTAVAGSSDVYRGGVVCYATDLKATLAGVPADVLDAHGPVAPETAAALARGVARACGADVGLATTGVAGPSPQDGHPVGEVYVAAALPGQEPEVRRLHLTGDREVVRTASVEAVLDLLLALADVLPGSLPEARPEG
jgi:nicotinamide-nucleotide amidase